MSPRKPNDGGKWGIMGGGFDPIHYAHLVLAEQARISFRLDGVLFIPSHLPPHKSSGPEASFEDRMAMIRLAIEGNDNFEISEIEKDMDGPGFTILLLERLEREYPGVDWYLILGSDNVAIFDDWHRPEDIAEKVKIVVGNRPGYEDVLTDSRWTDKISLVEMPSIDESSTYIRKAIKSGGTIRYLIPEPVRKYIDTKGLYR